MTCGVGWGDYAGSFLLLYRAELSSAKVWQASIFARPMLVSAYAGVITAFTTSGAANVRAI